MGYGLDLTKVPNVNRDALNYENLECPKRFEAFRSDVLEWCGGRDEIMEKMIFHENMKPPKYLADMTIYADEMGDPDRLVLLPAMSRNEWTRYGNMLDIHTWEAEHPTGYDDPDAFQAYWTPHPGTLYPYVGLMKSNPEHPFGVEKYWVPCYRNDPRHKDAVAWAPWHLWFMIKHMGLVPEENVTETFLQLRPGIYRHWG
jgi:hypothetical protein